ncbi:hypothetical protein B0H13DRAFT_1905802 [Mycena leptocephala]|nr:hypothetical protein B0H13DRAFT_1905802 [Mycena leptocephala]
MELVVGPTQPEISGVKSATESWAVVTIQAPGQAMSRRMVNEQARNRIIRLLMGSHGTWDAAPKYAQYGVDAQQWYHLCCASRHSSRQTLEFNQTRVSRHSAMTLYLDAVSNYNTQKKPGPMQLTGTST